MFPPAVNPRTAVTPPKEFAKLLRTDSIGIRKVHKSAEISTAPTIPKVPAGMVVLHFLFLAQKAFHIAQLVGKLEMAQNFGRTVLAPVWTKGGVWRSWVKSGV